MAFFVALDFNASPITNFISKNAITAGLSGMFEPGALRWTTIFEPWAHHRNHHWGFFRLRPIISLAPMLPAGILLAANGKHPIHAHDNPRHIALVEPLT